MSSGSERVRKKFTCAVLFAGMSIGTMLLLIVIALSTDVGLLLDCRREIKHPPPPIDVGPIVALDWPSDVEQVKDILDLEVLGSDYMAVDNRPFVSDDGRLVHGTIECRTMRSSGLDVTRVEALFETHGPVEWAEEDFIYECANRGYFQDRSDFVYGEEGDTQWCISNLRTTRSDWMGLCLPTQTIRLQVIIRKRNVIMVLDEYSASKTDRNMNQCIKQLVEAMQGQDTEEESAP